MELFNPNLLRIVPEWTRTSTPCRVYSWTFKKRRKVERKTRSNNTLLYKSIIQARKTQTAISSTKAKTVGQRDINLAVLGLICCVVAIEPICKPIQIDSRWHDTLKPSAKSIQHSQRIPGQWLTSLMARTLNTASIAPAPPRR